MKDIPRHFHYFIKQRDLFPADMIVPPATIEHQRSASHSRRILFRSISNNQDMRIFEKREAITVNKKKKELIE